MLLMQNPMSGLGFCVALLLASMAYGATLYSEPASGDLSGNRNAPTNRTLVMGSNDLFATTSGGDQEYLTVVVPPGLALNNLFVRSYVSNDFTAFIGLQNGSSFTVDAFSAQPSDMRGYAHFGFGSVGRDILPEMAAAFDAQGFTRPLPAGQYTFWIQQLGPQSIYQMDFVAIPEPSCIALMAGCSLLFLRRRRA